MVGTLVGHLAANLALGLQPALFVDKKILVAWSLALGGYLANLISFCIGVTCLFFNNHMKAGTVELVMTIMSLILMTGTPFGIRYFSRHVDFISNRQLQWYGFWVSVAAFAWVCFIAHYSSATGGLRYFLLLSPLLCLITGFALWRSKKHNIDQERLLAGPVCRHCHYGMRNHPADIEKCPECSGPLSHLAEPRSGK
jgi:hypothetical protein